MAHSIKIDEELHTNLAEEESNSQVIHQTTIKPADGFQLKQTRLAIHKLSKPVFGRIVPYFRLCVEGVDEEKEILQSVDIPVARFQEAFDLMKTAFESDERYDNENFSQWGARKGYPFFSEMLEDLLPVGPDDLPRLLSVEPNSKAFEISGLNFV